MNIKAYDHFIARLGLALTFALLALLLGRATAEVLDAPGLWRLAAIPLVMGGAGFGVLAFGLVFGGRR